MRVQQRCSRPRSQEDLLSFPSRIVAGRGSSFRTSLDRNLLCFLLGSILLLKGTPGVAEHSARVMHREWQHARGINPRESEAGSQTGELTGGGSTETNLIPVLRETCPLGFSKSLCAFFFFFVPGEFRQNSPEPHEAGEQRPSLSWIGAFMGLTRSVSGGTEWGWQLGTEPSVAERLQYLQSWGDS